MALPELSITTDLGGQKAPLEPLFAAFAAAGFRAVHWCHDWIGEPVLYDAAFARQVGRLARRAGLRVADVHGFSGTDGTGVAWSEELFLAANVNRAEFAAAVGASVLVLHLPPLRQPPGDPAVRAAAGAIRALQPALKRCGLVAAIENLPCQEHADSFLEAMLGEYDERVLGFCYDSGHAVLSGQAHLLERHAGRLVATHLHDNDGSADQHRLPGAGRADWRRIMSVVVRPTYRGTINLEVNLPPGRDLGDFCREAYGVIAALRAGDVGTPPAGTAFASAGPP